MNDLNKLTIGSRVYDPSVYGGYATVMDIDGAVQNQAPETLGGGVLTVLPSGPQATIHVVYDDGRAHKLPEHMFFGLRPWELLDQIVGDLELERLKKQAVVYAAKQANDKARAKLDFDNGVAQLRRHHPHLRAAYEPNAAAKNIRKMLKRGFAHLKFSVRQRRGGAIDVDLRAGDASKDDFEAIQSVCNQFQSGFFDGMTDIYQPKETLWTAAFGGAKYVFFFDSRENGR